MATPVNNSYSGASGAKIYAGRAAPNAQPAWLSGKPLNQWFALPSTNGAASAAAGIMPRHPDAPTSIELNAYCGWVYVPGVGLVVAAPGGHSDGYDNSVVKCRILADTPDWVQLCAKSATHTPYVTGSNAPAYEPDGKPMSCHTYQGTLWSSILNRVMRVGCYGPSPWGDDNPGVDGFNLDTNTWDPAGTYPGGNTVGAPYYGAAVDGAGNLWSINGTGKFDPNTKTWSKPLTVTSATSLRYPWAWDSKRNQLFGLCFGNAQGGGSGVVAIRQSGTVQTNITFNSSTALDQFIADVPAYAGMVYEPNRDQFFFYSGVGAAAGRVYVVTPNSSTTWDMSIFVPDAGSAALPPTVSAGLHSRFTYIPELKGIAAMPDAAGNIYFMRTA